MTLAASRERWRRNSSRRVSARTPGYAEAIEAWLLKYARNASKRAVINVRSTNGPFAKRDPDEDREELEAELRRIMLRFGLRQVEDAGRRSANSAGGRWVLRPEVKYQYVREIENKVRLVMRDTEAMVRASLQDIIAEAFTESPRPTASQVARRIARQWHGPPVAEPVKRGSERAEDLTARWERGTLITHPGGDFRIDEGRVHYKQGKREFLFSFERAAAIARTELGDADTAGAAEGFVVSGVESVSWIARPYDGKSGDRRHHLMNRHKPIAIADMQSTDPSRWFELPSGARAPRPLYPGLPVGERVNCRCALVPA